MTGPRATGALETMADFATRTTEPRLLAALGSEVALVARSRVSGLGGRTIRETALLCPEEALASEVPVSHCSGVLVGPDLVVTAAHCLTDPGAVEETRDAVGDAAAACASLAVTRVHDAPVGASDAWSFEARPCAAILAADRNLDIAVLALAPGGPAWTPTAPLREAPLAGPTSALFVGHPLGSSTRVAAGATVSPSARGPDHAWLDAMVLPGASGGGVFDASGALIGLLTSGASAAALDADAGCMRLVAPGARKFHRVVSVGTALAEACGHKPPHPACTTAIFGGGSASRPSRKE